MQIKTAAIILNSHKHSDKTTIVNAYCKLYGRISFAAYGTHGKKSVVRAAHLQPLSIVELDLFYMPGRDIHRIKDLRMQCMFTSIPFDPVKSSIALFIAEMLTKTLRQPEEDELLYEFLEKSILQLDSKNANIADFHLVFLLQLSNFLGFYPNEENHDFRFFDLLNGVFEEQKPLHTHYLADEYAKLFYALLNCEQGETGHLHIARNTRKIMIDAILDYYKLHVPEFHKLNSLAVFQSLFD